MSSFPSIDPGTYLHHKTGKKYEVLGVALQTETDEPLVVYRPLWNSNYELFARPYTMFVGEVIINGMKKPRFEKLDD